MGKIFILISIIIFTGCCKEPKLLENGLTRKANKVIELTIKVDNDSLNIKNLDTIAIVEKYYNGNNQIIKRINNILFDSSVVEIDFVYNNSNRLEKEIVKLSFDTTTVNYFYKDTLLYKTFSKNIDTEFEFEQISIHKYNRNNKINKISTSQLSLNLTSKDTFINTLEVKNYNKNEELIERKLINYVHPKRSNRSLYKYKCGRRLSERKYNNKDSLVLIIHSEYTFDEFDNWIEIKSIEDSKLKYIKKRKIDYK